MRRSRRHLSLAVLALAAPLLLTSSGRGSDPAQPPEAAVCEVPGGTDAALDAQLDQLAAEAPAADASDLVVLNGRGYNYGPPPDAQLDAIRQEALRAKAELRARP